MRAINIEWDTEDNGVVYDPEELELPTEVDIPDGIDEEDVADFLSDVYGYCVCSYKVI